MAEEILNLLARVRELRLISRSSAFQYRGDDIHIPTVAEELNVSYVLEGSVRQSGDRIRITARLIDARADAHVWSENYDRELDDVFAIQDDIAQAIVDELQIELLGDRPSVERTDLETGVLYLNRALEYDPRWIELREPAGLSAGRLAAIRIEVPRIDGAEPRDSEESVSVTSRR